MNAFIKSFSHGFFHGMFGGAYCGLSPFVPNPFIGNPFACNPFTATFMMPRFCPGGFVPYQAPMPMSQPVFNYSFPNFNLDTAALWQGYNCSVPDFTPSFDLGDTFVKSKKPSKESEDDSKSVNAGQHKAKHWSKMTDSELREVYGNYTRDITKPYSGTASDLDKYLEDKGVLKGKGKAFIDAQNKYGISASVLVAICMNESAKGTSNLAKNKNNVGGVRIAGSKKFRTFESVEKCIDYMGSFLKSGYVDNSGRPLKQLYQINAKYCPVSDPTDKSGNNSRWAKAVDMYTKQVEEALA